MRRTKIGWLNESDEERESPFILWKASDTSPSIRAHLIRTAAAHDYARMLLAKAASLYLHTQAICIHQSIFRPISEGLICVIRRQEAARIASIGDQTQCLHRAE